MASTKEYVVRLTVEGDKVIQTAVALDDGLKKAGKQAQATGKEISGAMREARSGVIGIVNDLTGGLASKFMDVKDAIGGATQGMKGFKAALIGTGIGTLVVAIGALVGYREQLTGMILDASFNLSELNEQSKQAIQLADDLKAAWSLQERELRALGATEDEILKKRKESLLVQIQQAELAAELAKEAAVQAGVADKILEQQGASGFLARWYLGTEEKAAEQKTQFKSSIDRIKELKVQLLETEKAVTDNNKKQQEQRAADSKAAAEQRAIQEVEQEKARIQAISTATIETRQFTGEIEIAVEKEIAMRKSDTVIQVTQEQLAKEAAIQEEAARRRVDLQVTTAQTLLSIVDAFAATDQAKSEKARKRNFAIQKAAAIAQATIDTYLGAQKAYTSQLLPGDPTSIARAQVAAGVAIASGLAKVAIIARQKFEGGGGGGAASGGGGGSEGGSFSGFQNIQPQAPTTQTINPQAQSQPVQAYVLAGHVSSETEARKKIADQARL